MQGTIETLSLAVDSSKARVHTVAKELRCLLIYRSQLLTKAAPIRVKVDNNNVEFFHNMVEIFFI